MHPQNVIAVSDFQVWIVCGGWIFFMLVILGAFLDMSIGEHLERKIRLYPCIQFNCFCGFKQSLCGRGPFTWTYSVYAVINHTKKCLSWLIRFPELNVTHYYASEIAATELKGEIISPIMMRVYQSESTKVISGEKKF